MIKPEAANGRSQPAIKVQGLGKLFKLKQKAPGLVGSLKSVWRPTIKEITAVSGISFELEQGELLAFIGPNGAGKSTTIKMLTGILFPSEGQASVMGYTPWQQRRQLAYQIGSVFGQKPQLWYHLPPEDTFRLFSHIYELDEADYQRRRGFLVEAFQIQDFLQTPVRKLSLGQRMKCEIAASLLHGPRIIFLDEPTIGLDVVAKQQIRTAIRHLNETENVTIFLTSHDAGDVESLSRRVIVINHGRIIFNGRTSTLKRQYLTHKIVEVRFSEALDGTFALPHVTTLKQGTHGVKLSFNSQDVPVEQVMQQVISAKPCLDITITDPPLEEIIREIYQN